MTLQFYKYNRPELYKPFIGIEVEPYDEKGISGFVIHGKNDTTLIDDSHIHIYIEPIDNMDIEVSCYRGNKEDQIYYVRDTNGDFDMMDMLNEFFSSYFFTSNDEEYVEILNENDPYTLFVNEIETHISGDLESYIKEILKSMGIEQAFQHVRKYMSTFHVAMTAQDYNPDQLSNYEILEFAGDQSLWGPATILFISYAKKNNIELNKQRMAMLHQLFISKSFQAGIGKALRFDAYLKIKGEVTMSVYEDLFESFVGALALINFNIRANININYRLHEKFINWVFADYDFDSKTTKPEITKFYEYSRALTGYSAFNDKDIGRSYIIRIIAYDENNKPKSRIESEEAVCNIIKHRLLTLLNVELNDKFYSDFLRMIKTPYNGGIGFQERRDRKYKEITSLIDRTLPPGAINKLTTENKIQDWNIDIRNELEYALRELGIDNYIISDRGSDKKKMEKYWVIQNDQETLFETMTYDNPCDPQTLLDIVLEYKAYGKITTETAQVKKVKFNDQPMFIRTIDDDKYYIEGNIDVVDKYLKLAVNNGDKVYVRIDMSIDILSILAKYPDSLIINDKLFIPYEPRDMYFSDYLSTIEMHNKSIDMDKLLKYLGYNSDRQRIDKIYNPEMGTYLHGYLGDRALYEYTALIALLGRRALNPNHLTKIKNFYRSKEFKEYISNLIGIVEDDKIVPFDILVGRSFLNSEKIANIIYINLIIDIDVTYTPGKALKSIRRILYEEKDRQNKRVADRVEKLNLEKEREKEASVRFINGEYRYNTSNDIDISIMVGNLKYSKIENIFIKLMLFYEEYTNHNISTIRNTRFLTNQGFDVLKLTMQVRMIKIWYLSYTQKRSDGSRKILLTYFDIDKGQTKVYYYSGPNLLSINQQLI